jgi:hypothetical protein
MKLIFYASFFLSLITFSSFGQVKSSLDSIDYNLFKSYNIDYRSLTLQGSRYFNYTADNKFLSNSFDLFMRQNNYTNLEKKQSFHSHNLQTNYSSNTNNRSSISFSPVTQNAERYYYTPNMFYEVNYSGSISSRYLFSNKSNTRDDLDATLGSSVGIRVGKGRINPIDEVFTAAFIIDEIKNEGIDVSTFNQETLFEFGQLLVLMLNRRILDSRRLKVIQFLELSKFMDAHISTDEVSKAMVNAIIMDNIFFANNPSRFSGYRISFGIEPSGLYYINKKKENPNRLGFTSSFHLEYNKVISRYFNFNAYSKFEADKIKTAGVESELEFGTYANLGILYYPISRTNMSAGISYSKYQMDKNLSFVSHIRYFINYNTQFDASLKINFTGQKSANYTFNIYHSFY